MYKDIKQPEIIKGLKVWKNKGNKFTVAMLHYSADLNKDPERKGEKWYEKEREGTTNAAWNKEYEIDFSTKSGKLVYGPEYCDFSNSFHLINSFSLPEPYERIISLDFGQRNPTCALIGIWTSENILYIVDEYYKPAIPSVASREMFVKFKDHFGTDIENKTPSEKKNLVYSCFGTRVIDPSTGAKNRTKIIEGQEMPYSVKEDFEDHGWDFELAKNDIEAGITRIRQYFQINNGKASLYIFRDKCPNLVQELLNYRYKELSEVQLKTRNESDVPVKKNDHAMDALRYMVMTRPQTPQLAPRAKTKVEKHIEFLLKPKISTGWDVD